MKVPQFVNYWMPVFAWMVVIFIGSTDVLSSEHTSRFLVPLLQWVYPHISNSAVNTIHLLVRKFGHVSEYAILAVLFWRALRGGTSWRTKFSILFVSALMGCVAFAVSDEFHQSFVPSRTPSARDVMIDICGASFALMLCWIFTARRAAPVSESRPA
jgi:VanZ family protein